MTKLEIEIRIRDAIRRLNPHVCDDLVDLEWEENLSQVIESYVQFRIKEAIREMQTEVIFLEAYRKKHGKDPTVS